MCRAELYSAFVCECVFCLSCVCAVFVCSEVVTEKGDRITADFLTVKVGDKYEVVEVIMNNRASVKKMMGME